MITFMIIVKITQSMKTLGRNQRISALTLTPVLSGNENKLLV